MKTYWVTMNTVVRGDYGVVVAADNPEAARERAMDSVQLFYTEVDVYVNRIKVYSGPEGKPKTRLVHTWPLGIDGG